jgi:hypothetical protein
MLGRAKGVVSLSNLLRCLKLLCFSVTHKEGLMLRTCWRCVGMILIALSGTALADGHGHGKHNRDDDRDRHY